MIIPKKNILKISKDEFNLGWSEFPENDFLMEHLFVDSLRTLVKTQGLAAENAEYNQNKQGWSSELKKYVWQGGESQPAFGTNTAQTSWSAMYLGTANLPVAKDSAQLQKQIDTISESSRTSIDKNYEVAKAANRYWISQICEKAGSDALIDLLTKTEWADTPEHVHQSQVNSFQNKYGILLKRDFNSKYTPYPWQNPGESILPDGVRTKLSEDNEDFYNTFKREAETFYSNFLDYQSPAEPEKDEPEKVEKKKDLSQKYDPNELRDKPGSGETGKEPVEIGGIYVISLKKKKQGVRMMDAEIISQNEDGSFSVKLPNGKIRNIQANMVLEKSKSPQMPVVGESETVDTAPATGETDAVTVDDIRQYLEQNTQFHYDDDDNLHAVEIHDTILYLHEQHGLDVLPEDVDTVPFIGKDIEGHADLYGTLEGEPDGSGDIGFTRIAYDSEGNVHKRWTPNLAFLNNDNHTNITDHD